VIETTDASAVREAFDGVAPVYDLGRADDSGRLDLALAGTDLSYGAAEIAELRDVIERELD
jgi:phosphoribosylformylglycinamidine synthase